MSGESIRIVITPDGITYEASGFTGGKCMEKYKEFVEYMRSIGVEVKETKQVLKDEIYQTEETSVQNHY